MSIERAVVASRHILQKASAGKPPSSSTSGIVGGGTAGGEPAGQRSGGVVASSPERKSLNDGRLISRESMSAGCPTTRERCFEEEL